MPCTSGCGSCCDPVSLDDDQAQRVFVFGPARPQAAWIYDNWSPIGPGLTEDSTLLKCANYDVEARACLAYESRPPVCKEFPFYGVDPAFRDVGNICGYQAENGRTVLPLVEVR